MLGEIIRTIYKVAIYIRLSKEDADRGFDESESITNQKTLLLEYVKKLGPNYDLVDIYIDPGYTGTNFNRPDFKRMINDINLGKVNMVITKTLSRLGRDYIETGRYIENYFPEHNVSIEVFQKIRAKLFPFLWQGKIITEYHFYPTLPANDRVRRGVHQ